MRTNKNPKQTIMTSAPSSSSAPRRTSPDLSQHHATGPTHPLNTRLNILPSRPQPNNHTLGNRNLNNHTLDNHNPINHISDNHNLNNHNP